MVDTASSAILRIVSIVRKMALSSTCERPSSRRRLSARRCSHRRDGRSAQIAVGNVVIAPVRSEQMNPAQVTRVVANDHLLCHAHPGAQHIRPIRHRMQRNALAPDEAPFDRQEIDKKPMRVGYCDGLAAARVVASPDIPRSHAANGVVPNALWTSRW